jgi:hypothetical protein
LSTAGPQENLYAVPNLKDGNSDQKLLHRIQRNVYLLPETGAALSFATGKDCH